MFVARTHAEDILDRADFAVMALEALGQLVSHAFGTGEDMREYESGVSFLFEPHLVTLAECLKVARKDKMARNLEKTAREFAEIDRTNKAAEEAENGSGRVRTIRRDLISEAVTKGIEPEEIANAMNMRRSAVEAVIRKLRGEAGLAPDEVAAAVNG